MINRTFQAYICKCGQGTAKWHYIIIILLQEVRYKSILVKFAFFTPKCIKTAFLSSPKIWRWNFHY